MPKPWYGIKLPDREMYARIPKGPRYSDFILRPHCAKGHVYEGASFYIDKYGRRRCRICLKAINRLVYERRKARKALALRCE